MRAPIALWIAVATLLGGLAAGCGKNCRQQEGCPHFGQCTQRDGACVVGSDQDCRGSDQCRKFGHCFARGGSCVAGSDEDCRASNPCKHLGDCVADHGECRPGSNEDCARSAMCASMGMCSRTPAASNVDECRSQEAAQPWNQWPVPQRAPQAPGPEWRLNDPCYAFCAPGSDADCQRSEECRTKGFCEYAHGIQGVSYSHCVKKGTAPPLGALPGLVH